MQLWSNNFVFLCDIRSVVNRIVVKIMFGSMVLRLEIRLVVFS